MAPDEGGRMRKDRGAQASGARKARRAVLACAVLALVLLSAGVIADAASAEPLRAAAAPELAQDKVDAITDWSFNDQKPFPCVCFETGEKWHYVWTRDLSYAADLALAR